MKALIAPCYYPFFSCIADRCKNNCCIGWEIDIDPKTYQYYQTLSGPFGKRMDKAISLEGESPHFRLDAKERCPFLAKNGLCDIISELGENALCNICKDHPRFRNHYSGTIEIGLGLCCEEAARLILTQTEEMHLISLDSKEEQYNEEERILLSFRNELFEILQKRSVPFHERINQIADRGRFILPSPSHYFPILKDTERMDASFNHSLDHIFCKEWPVFNSKEWEIPLEQLAIYFLYRHLSGALEDGFLQERIAFALLSVLTIATITMQQADCDFSLKLLIDTARIYSCEIEYSDQNLEKILSSLQLS